jgi:CrcB protein
MRRAIAVFIGGGLGATFRSLLVLALAPWGSLPAVLLINGAGAFLLGLVYVLAEDAGLLSTEARLFIAVGILGGFTTFSTFAWDAVVSAGNGTPLTAICYVAASVVGGIGAVGLGIVAAHEFLDGLEKLAAATFVRLRRRHRRTSNVGADIGVIEAEDREESA